MLEWMKKGASTVHKEARADPDATKRHSQHYAGKHRSLYEYLEKRYADTFVLTFGQLEDLLGVSLPDLARIDPEWWTTADFSSAEVRCADAWTLANRTARPNLMAQTVAFERIVSLDMRALDRSRVGLILRSLMDSCVRLSLTGCEASRRDRAASPAASAHRRPTAMLR